MILMGLTLDWGLHIKNQLLCRMPVSIICRIQYQLFSRILKKSVEYQKL